jgi:hypothetical protein
MASRRLTRSLARVAQRAPALKRVPVLKLLAAAELAVATRDHLRRLTPEERRRIATLIRVGRGRRRNLTEAEREELSALIAKVEPRLLAGQAVEAFSPVPLPRRLVYGRARARPRS